MKRAGREQELGFPSALRVSTRERRWLFAVTMLALSLRIGTILVLQTYQFPSGERYIEFGWETGRIAESIASGQGFSNPFKEPTGPSAWVAPFYPYIVGSVFEVWGVYSAAAAFVLLSLNSLFSALTCVPVYLIARYTFGEKLARWSTWVWALLPHAGYWAVRWIWDTSLSAFLLALVFLVMLALEEAQVWKLWALFGVLLGAAALTNPAIGSFVPFGLAWVLYRRSKQGRPFLWPVAIAGTTLLVVVTPWLARNYAVFRNGVFIRSNFGVELSLGNRPMSEGACIIALHPTQDPLAFAQFMKLGEIEYAAQEKNKAVRFIVENPRRFLTISLRRLIFFWDTPPRSQWRFNLLLVYSVLAWWGLWVALRQHRPGAVLFGILLLTYPLVYYITCPDTRYRHPIEPEMIILGVVLLAEAWKSRK